MKAISTVENRTLASQAREAAQAANPRKQNWSAPRPSKLIRKLGEVTADTINYKGRFKGYTGSSFVPRYTSFLRADNKLAVLTYGFAGALKVRKLRAPSGTEWDHDGSIISADYRVEYHPTPDDLLARNFAERVKAGLAEAKIRRAASDALKREQMRVHHIYEREVQSTRVSLDDSRRAGNCIEGSLRFAERKLGLSRDDVIAGRYLVSVSAPRLLALANGDEKFVERAIRVAFDRETIVSI